MFFNLILIIYFYINISITIKVKKFFTNYYTFSYKKFYKLKVIKFYLKKCF